MVRVESFEGSWVGGEDLDELHIVWPHHGCREWSWERNELWFFLNAKMIYFSGAKRYAKHFFIDYLFILMLHIYLEGKSGFSATQQQRELSSFPRNIATAWWPGRYYVNTRRLRQVFDEMPPSFGVHQIGVPSNLRLEIDQQPFFSAKPKTYATCVRH